MVEEQARRAASYLEDIAFAVSFLGLERQKAPFSNAAKYATIDRVKMR